MRRSGVPARRKVPLDRAAAVALERPSTMIAVNDALICQ